MEDVVKGIGGEYTGNYTGPYWSNGKVQPSVEWGDETPMNELDYLSRQHDSAYARYADDAHREAADMYYNEQAQKLKQKFPSLAGNLVLYGNYADRAAKRLASNVATGTGLFGPIGGLGGLLYTAAGNIVRSNDMINGKYLSNEKKDILEYFKSDPKLQQFADRAPKARLSTGFNKPRNSNVLSGTLPVMPKVKVTPLPKIDELSDPVEAQARRAQNYINLKNQAINSTKSKNSENTNPIEFLGYRPKFMQKAFRKRKKKNKIHLEPVRI